MRAHLKGSCIFIGVFDADSYQQRIEAWKGWPPQLLGLEHRPSSLTTFSRRISAVMLNFALMCVKEFFVVFIAPLTVEIQPMWPIAILCDDHQIMTYHVHAW